MIHLNAQNTGNTSNRIIRIKETTYITGISRSSIYDKLNPESKRHDPSFPKPVKLGMSAIGWHLEEILVWINSLNSIN